MEVTEAGLELLVKKLRNLIESKIGSLTAPEISAISKKIPNVQSMLEFRDIRDNFLSRFNDPCEIPQATSYAESLLKNATNDNDLPAETEVSLRDFFEKEIVRATSIRETVLGRCKLPDNFTETHFAFTIFNDSIAKHLFNCEEGLSRLDVKHLAIYNTNDLLTELKTTFAHKRRKAFFNTLLTYIKRFPLTCRQSIFVNMFEQTMQSFRDDLKRDTVPVLIREEKGINEELYRLACCFQMNSDLDSHDGQRFLYFSNKEFHSLWNEILNFRFSCSTDTFPEIATYPDLSELTQASLISNFPHDVKLRVLFDNLMNLSEDEVLSSIQEQTLNYNVWVGNEAHGRSGYEIHKPLIPTHKITAWLELRFIHSKFLMYAVLSQINYFQYIRSKLQATDPSYMHSNNYRARQNSKFPEIIEVFDGDNNMYIGPTLEMYNKTVDNMIAIGSYFIAEFESKASERSHGETVVVDREAIVETLLRYELDYLKAKRRLIQPLLEALEHKADPKLFQLVNELIIERPKLNLPIYKSFDAPYRLAIDLMEKKGNIIRTLLNLQILHERQVASMMGDHVPLFDKPALLPSIYTARTFDESIPTTPFEVYESLADISKFIALIPKITHEFADAANIKYAKFGNYIEMAVWMELENLITNMTTKGFFPFERSALKFYFPLSKSIHSLFTSNFVNTIYAIEDMIEGMKEQRKLRFLLSTRRFMHLTWKLQVKIVETNLLQNAYYEQCKLLGISDRSVLMASFKESATNEIIDLNSNVNDDLIDFALTEFENVTLDFNSESAIKDIIFAADFSVLKRLIKFQNLQNTLLEIAVRFNCNLIDSNFLVTYFELGTDSNTFLTGIDIPEDGVESEKFFKQFIAIRMFYSSSTIFRDNQLAQMNKDQFCLMIKAIKANSRTILSAHAKQKEMADNEMFDLYFSEIIDAFAAFAYRVEIARICNLERQILLTNSFIDTYVLGPDPTTCLINDAGRFEKFFYVPTWVEVFSMLRGAPHARQGTVLKTALQFITSRYRILALVRHECSLSQRTHVVFDTYYNQCFQCETPVFQKLFNDFVKLPNSQEVEISTKYICETEKFYFHRFEFAILTAFESFFISLNIDTTDKKVEHKVADPKFGDDMKELWLQMHDQLDDDRGLITELRYIPLWQQQFVYKCNETDRAELVTRLTSTDAFLLEALTSMHVPSLVEDSIQALPAAIDFLCLSISQFHIKLAYFLLLEGVEESKISIRSSIADMSEAIFVRGTPKWEDFIIKEANKHLVPKDEAPSKVTESIPEPKLAQSIFDVVRSQVDLILLSSQINVVETAIDQLTNDFDKIRGVTTQMSRIVFKKPNETTEGRIYIASPDELKDQFNTEMSHSHSYLVENLYEFFLKCVINKENDEILVDAHIFEDNCISLSNTINMFSNDSLNQLISTWQRQLSTVSSSISRNDETNMVLSTIGQFTTFRFDRQIESEIRTKFYSQYIQLNALRYRLHTLEELRTNTEQQIEKDLRNKYNELIKDLHIETDRTLIARKGIKRKVFDDVLEKINSAKSVAMHFRDKISSRDVVETATFNPNNITLDDTFLNGIREQNDKVLKKILVKRIFRSISEIGVRKHYTKRLKNVVIDKKEANVLLWSEKLKAEFQEASIEEKLYRTHQDLSELEIEIEKLKAQLDNEKMSNIQLVHWKAKNLKTISSLKEQLDNYQGIGDINIDKLVKELDAATAELEELEEIGYELDTITYEEIKKPMRNVEKMRRAVRESKIARTAILGLTGSESFFKERQTTKESFVQQLSDENIQLRHSNETLQAQIEELEKQKAQKSIQVRQFMEDTLNHKSPSIRQMKKGKIVRPSLFPRAASRI